jgi:uncharacterized protein YjbI with pentapeptide repeats
MIPQSRMPHTIWLAACEAAFRNCDTVARNGQVGSAKLCSVEVSKEGDVADPEDLKRLLAGEKDQVRADLNEADVSGRKLAGFDFQWAQLNRIVGVNTNFSGCNFRNASLFGLNGTEADFQNASFPSIIMRVNFEQANLRGASLKESEIRETNFRGADIRGASFADAHIESTDFSAAIVDDSTDFSGAYVGRSFAAQEIFKGYSYEQGRLIRKSEVAPFPGPAPSTNGGGVAGQGLAGELTTKVGGGAVGGGAVGEFALAEGQSLRVSRLPAGTAANIARRLAEDPETFERLASNAAQSIQRQLDDLASRKPNDPDLLDGYSTVTQALLSFKEQFELLSSDLRQARLSPDPELKRSRVEKAASVAVALYDGVLDWMYENGDKAGRVIIHLSLAGVITGALSYFAGVPAALSFPVAAAALEGQSIWEVLKQFVPKGK